MFWVKLTLISVNRRFIVKQVAQNRRQTVKMVVFRQFKNAIVVFSQAFYKFCFPHKQVRYRGPLTFLKCQNTQFSPRLLSSDTAEEAWGQLVDEETTVLVCPGDHYSMSELPHAHVTGSVLATTLVFNYRVLFPEFLRPTRTFSQRRAVEKLCRGVNAFLHSKRGNNRN